MKETESKSIEYISGVFKGLPAEKQDYLLDTARSLLQVQIGDIYPIEGEAASPKKMERLTVLEPLSAYASKKI